MLKNDGEGIKPWLRLGMSRKEYAASKIWKTAGLKRKAFEKYLALMPDEFIAEAKREGEADLLVKSIFGDS